MNRDPCGIVEWAATVRALPGMIECGDRCAIGSFPDGVTLALIDGLGHGHEAALAARVIATTVEENAVLDPKRLIELCHENARSTRGAVMTVARVDARTASVAWAGVGNVDAVLLRASLSASVSRESLVPRGGVVGTKSPSVHSTTLSIARGDVLVFASDGIRSGFHAALSPHRAASALADEVIDEYGKDTDDASVLVARYEGGFVTEETIVLAGDADVIDVRQTARRRATAIGLETARCEALATAVTEIARNALVHASGGTVSFGECEGDRAGVLVVARDDGPGIDDVARAMQDGWTTIGTLGLGLPSARRLIDDFRIVSAPGRGTTVVMRQWA